MNKQEILEKIYSLIDTDDILNIFFQEIIKLFPFDTCAFFRLKDHKSLSILSLILPQEYESFNSSYKNMNFKLNDSSLFKESFLKKKTVFVSQQQISEEKNSLKKRRGEKRRK